MNHILSDNEAWTKRQWSSAKLGDARRNKRAVKIGDCMLRKPTASLPNQMKDFYDLKAVYRLLNEEDVTHGALQEVHWNNVKEAANKTKNTVLMIQDTSELDYSSKKSIEGLGPIGNHKGRGVLIHSTLAVEFGKNGPESVLGLAHQSAWIRDNIARRQTEKRSERAKRRTEADCWIESLENIGMPDHQDTQWVSVGDRGNDIYKFIRYCTRTGRNFLVRANTNRVIVTTEGKKEKLSDFVRSLPEQTTKKIDLRSRPGKAGREAILYVAWSTILVITPKFFPKKEHETIKLSCIRVWDKSDSSLEWILTTNLEIANQADALEKIAWYESRWLIEEYHKCLKTGCRIQNSQLKKAGGLLSLLGFLGVIATRLLAIKFFIRLNSSAKAKDHFPIEGIHLLCSRYKLSAETMTCNQFWRCIARLGGFLGRKSDGNPGWQTSWSGWVSFLDMLSTLNLIGQMESIKPEKNEDIWTAIADKIMGKMELKKCG